MNTPAEIKTAIETFAAIVQERKDAHHEKEGHHDFMRETVRVKFGRKYAKLIECRNGEKDGAVHSFVSLETGDIFKAAGYNAPAKHARGNVLSDENGAESLGGFNNARIYYLA